MLGMKVLPMFQRLRVESQRARQDLRNGVGPNINIFVDTSAKLFYSETALKVYISFQKRNDF